MINWDLLGFARLKVSEKFVAMDISFFEAELIEVDER